MKLVRLTVDKLPGIEDRLELAPAADRASVVIGPNASGKTSLIRALSALLQHNPDRRPVDIEAEFGDGEHRIKGRAIGQARSWWRDGDKIDRPDWPGTDRLAAYLIRADELADAGATEQRFSETLRQVMAGGYDLDALAGSAPFETPARPQKLARQYHAAGDRLQALETRHAELAAAIDQLETLRRQHRESIEAQRRLQAQRRALELLDLERQLAATGRARDDFPAGMDRLDGSEGERLERLEREIAQRRQRLERAREARTEALRTLAGSGIEDIDALEAFAADLADRRQRLETRERRREELQQQCRDLERTRLAAARGAGRLQAERGAILDDEALDGLEKLADRVRSTQANIDTLEREMTWRDRDVPDPETRADLEAGIDALRAWLASPPATAVGWATWGLLLAGAAGAAAWAWWALENGFLAALAGAAALMPLSHTVAQAARAWRMAKLRARFEATGLEFPARWRRPEVGQRVQQLETRLAEHLRRQTEAARSAELEAELGSVRERLHSERRQLEMAADRLQVRTEWALETTGQLRLRALLELREAEGRLQRARSALDDLGQQFGALVEDIRSAFDRAGRQAPATIDADSIGSFLNRLNPQLGEARSARDALRNADARTGELEDELETLETERRAVFERAGLGDDPGSIGNSDRQASDGDARGGHDGKHALLRERLRRLGDWNVLNDERRGLERARQLALEALEDDPDLRDMARARDETMLMQLGETLSAAAEQRDVLAERIATIENERKAALEQRELERLNAERERLRAELERALEAHRDAEAAQLLVERARAGYTHQHQPALFTRARNLFARMTRTRFELNFDGHRFGARDQAMAENRSIAELSTATRIQLLLALRLAWIEEAEHDGSRLPIFLDEVLATTDPERYRAVVEAVQELVRGGRQVIYLSSQPADAEAWQRFAGEPAPKIIELAPIGDESFGFELPEPPPCPDPRLDAEAWAEQARVARLDPWRGAAATELFHLLRDRLDALVELRNFGVITLGQFEHAREAALDLPVDTDVARTLDDRIQAARAWLERWRRGHLPPLPGRELAESAAVSETFIEPVSALNRELDGNARALVDALRDGRVARFRSDKTDQLEAQLGASGYLDERQPPGDAELIDALARAGGLDFDQAARLHRWLQAALA